MKIMDDDNKVFKPADAVALKGAITEARAQIASGQAIPLHDVADWLASWGTPNERPAPSPQ